MTNNRDGSRVSTEEVSLEPAGMEAKQLESDKAMVGGSISTEKTGGIASERDERKEEVKSTACTSPTDDMTVDKKMAKVAANSDDPVLMEKERQQRLVELALVERLSSNDAANAKEDPNHHPFIEDLLRGSDTTSTTQAAQAANNKSKGAVDASTDDSAAAEDPILDISGMTPVPSPSPALTAREQADLGHPGAFAIGSNLMGSTSSRRQRPSPRNSSRRPNDPSPPTPELEPYTTTARLVTDEDNAERLRAELEQMRAAPTAEVVGTDIQQAQDGLKDKRQPERRRPGVVMAVVLLVVAFVIVLIYLIASAIDGNEDEGNGLTQAAPVDQDLDDESTESTALLQPVLKTVQERGYIRCWANYDERQRGYGVSLELCKALSAAIFNGDPNRTEYSEVSFKESWESLDYSNTDVSTSHITFNMRRDIYETYTERPKSFSAPWFFTGVHLGGVPDMVKCAEQGNTLTGVCKDVVVCVSEATTTNDVVQKHLDGSGIYLYDSAYDNAKLAFIDGRCNVIASEPQELYEQSIRESGYTGEYVLGTKALSKEPLAMAMRGDDPQWADFCDSVLQALFTAELENITQSNASLFPQTGLFGEEYKDMYRNAIAAVGNWGDIFGRTFALNRLIVRSGQNLIVRPEGEEAGLLYSPPLSIVNLGPNLQSQQLPGPVSNGTLEMISERGSLQCGVFPDRPGFVEEVASHSNTTSNATLVGFDIDLCKCVATALLGDKELVDFVELEDSSAGYSALASGLVDVVAGMPYNFGADIHEESTEMGYSFSPVYFYGDGGEMLTLVTNQDELQWSDFVRWTVYGLIHAEESGIGKEDPSSMPSVDVFGLNYRQMFRLIVLDFGNYGDLYEANLGGLIPRKGHNLLNDGSTPLIKPLPIDQFSA